MSTATMCAGDVPASTSVGAPVPQPISSTWVRGPYARNEPDGPTRAFCCSWSLPGQPAEQLEEECGDSIRRRHCHTL